jgi:hypothetical protein
MGIFACATATQPSNEARLGKIADVRVEREGDATVVTLMGLDDPVFTAFQQPDPERIIIDLADVESDAMSGPIAVYDGLVDEITMSPFSTGSGDPMTRVEISTAGAAIFEVTNTDEGLYVRMESAPGLAVEEAAEEDVFEDASAEEEFGESEGMSDPWAIEPMEAELAADEPEPAVEDTTPATKLTSVTAREVGEGSLVELGADGVIASAVSFTLENPDRLVIDLPEMVSEVESGRIEVGSSRVERIRVGQHDDMVRVVVDAGGAPEPFEGRRVVPGPAGLWIALGSGSELEVALDEATASAQPPASMAMADDSAESLAMDATEPAETAEMADVTETEPETAMEPESEPETVVASQDGDPG